MLIRSSLPFVLVCSTALAGCSMAPTYVRPEMPVPTELPAGGVYPPAASDAPDITRIGWRDFFTDPRLVQLIDTGLENNRDLRIAAANVMQARAQYRVQRADRVPSVGVSGVASRSQPITSSPNVSLENYALQGGFSAFELDLFGRVANLSRAAQEQFFASEEAQRATRISLIAEIASAWLQMAADQDQLRISQNALTSFQESLRLSEARFRIGVASELEARQAETAFQSARADIAALKSQIAQDRNAINLLVGTQAPADLLPDALGTGGYTLDALPGEIDSRVLLQRPDVLQAEHQLIAENANIGAARAAFFPNISLTGLLGTASNALGGLFGSGSFSSSAEGALALPIFDGGRNKGNLDFAKASRELALANYEKAIQTAFREVADALAQRGTIDEQLAAQSDRTVAAETTLRLSEARFEAGVDSYLVALDAQRTAYSSQQQLVDTRLARALNLINLYRSLGGGMSTTP
ncbi:MAG: transporter [Sphingopyxis sp.]|nr:MAG: transporter [Sphingopyxis sp.]